MIALQPRLKTCVEVAAHAWLADLVYEGVEPTVVEDVSMYRDDYILRAIRQVLTLLPYIRRMVQEQRHGAALDTVAQTVRRLLGVPPDDLAFSLRNVLPYLRVDALTDLDREQHLALAALLREAGDIYTVQQRGDAAYACYLQALSVLLDMRSVDRVTAVPSYVPSVEALDRALRGFELPQATYLRLLGYYEHAGAYATAEDVLFMVRDARPHDPRIAAVGWAFYHRLLQKSDADLSVGNLPRDEVEDGLARWQG